MVTENEILTGLVIDELTTLSLQELSSACHVEPAWLIQLVEEGILEPKGKARNSWHFAGGSLRRVLIVRRLQEDLGVNMQGAALALDMLDEIERLRCRLSRLEL